MRLWYNYKSQYYIYSVIIIRFTYQAFRNFTCHLMPQCFCCWRGICCCYILIRVESSFLSPTLYQHIPLPAVILAVCAAKYASLCDLANFMTNHNPLKNQFCPNMTQMVSNVNEACWELLAKGEMF